MDKSKYTMFFFDTLIKDADCYYAHLPKDDEKQLPELLSYHSKLTFDYACSIIASQSLEECIFKLIDLSIPPFVSDKKYVLEEVHTLFYEAIAFHDLGKINGGFQNYVMKNKRNIDVEFLKHNFGSQHSVLSMYIYLALSLYRILKVEDDRVRMFLYGMAVYFSYNIVQHHSSMLFQLQNDIVWSNENLEDLSPYLSLLNGYNFSDDFIELFHFILKNTNCEAGNVFSQMNDCVLADTDSFPLYVLMRLHYSILTSSDYLATAHYMNGWKNVVTDFGVITKDLRYRIINNAFNYKYNKEIYESLIRNMPPDNCTVIEKNNDNLNLLRKNLAIEVISNICDNRDKNLFYLEAPTGGGKTNVSILAIAELLKDEKLNKIFYVFPFTTLITQTYSTLKEVLGLDKDEITELHSKSVRFSYEKSDDETALDNYMNEYISYIDGLFVNYPVVLLSHVRFFEYLTTNKKDANYAYSRLANSIVVLDEIQSYSPTTWNAISYFIEKYSSLLNMKFVVMSATLPKIGEIIKGADFTYLIKDKNKYFLNPNFCERVKFDYSLLEWVTPHSIEQRNCYLRRLHDKLLKESVSYANENIISNNSVYTVVEFIYKRSASEFYALFSQDDFFDEIYLLSGTILEPRRKEIISNLKSPEYRRKKILLISTQVVEAGVDIDMDLGFKDKSIVDSEEQLAGRVNRNAKKQNCKMFIFDYDSSDSIYGKDMRFKIMRSLHINEYKQILEYKDFDYLYRKVLNDILRQNSSSYFDNLKTIEENISILDYSKIAKSVTLIDTGSIAVFVPLVMRIDILGDITHLLDELDIFYDEFLNGKNVWNKYVDLLQNTYCDFVRFKCMLMKIKGIMSYFTFSVFPSGQDFNVLRTYGEEKYGFLYLESYHGIYTYEGGINTDSFKDSIFI